MSIPKALAAAALTLALAPATAVAYEPGKTYHIAGKGEGEVTVNLVTRELDGHVTWTLSHLGKVTSQIFPIETVRTPDATRGRGTVVLTHVSGDTLTGTYTSLGPPPTAEVHVSVFESTITGGTGRFSGATGTLRSPLTITRTRFPTPESPIVGEHLEGFSEGWVRF
jgi:hypothetical protein